MTSGESVFDYVRDGNTSEVSSLLFLDSDTSTPNLEADPNWQDVDGKTPLHVAVEQYSLDILEILLLHPNLNPNLQDYLGFTPLLSACHFEYLDCLELLLKDSRVDVNMAQIEGASPLLVTCENGQMHVVRLLLEHPDIDPNQPDLDGNVPLMVAVGFENLELARLLLQNPSCEREIPGAALTPFQAACEGWNQELIDLFFEYGVGDVNFQQRDGKTVLFSACLHKKELVNRLLFECPEIDITLALNKQESIERTQHQNWTEFLNKFSQDFITPKDLAVSKGDADLVELLTAFEIDPVACRQQLGLDLGITGRLIAETFAIAVFFCDDYLSVRTPRYGTFTEREQKAARFFRIASQLHLDLQMVLCNRTQGLARNIIPFKEREAAFKKWTTALK